MASVLPGQPSKTSADPGRNKQQQNDALLQGHNKIVAPVALLSWCLLKDKGSPIRCCLAYTSLHISNLFYICQMTMPVSSAMR